MFQRKVGHQGKIASCFKEEKVTCAISSKSELNSIVQSADMRIRSSRVVRESDCQCRSRSCRGFDPSCLRHSGTGICGAADETVLNKVLEKSIKKSPFNLPTLPAPM
jgi:hypothetical protein